jgi:hypothetical protein
LIRSVFFAVLFAAPALFGGIVATNLECGSWSNPLGIDAPNPRLTWQLQTTTPGARAQMQAACRVLVSTNLNDLTINVGDLWDSGQVATALPSINYAGASLVSEQQVFWKVQVWDQSNNPSGWSSTATWTMGLLNPTNWLGSWLAAATNAGDSLSGCNWIWYPEGNPTVSAPVASRYFLKTFVLSPNAVSGAELLVTADNGYTAYLNGTQVSTGNKWQALTPVSVAGQLVAGTNVLAIVATNTAVSPAGLIGELIVNYAGAAQTDIRMDATWLTANTLQTGWNLPGFNDSSWTNALVLGSYGISPWKTGVTITTGTGLPIFRRDFVVQPGLQRAVISICGLGQYELSANGAKVGNALLGGQWSKYDRTCLYDTMDITSYLNRSATNTLGVMLGNGFYNVQAGTGRYDWLEIVTGGTVSYGPPMVIAQLHLYYTNGTSQVIASDGQWQTTAGPITFSSVYGGEDYNPQLLAAGWNQPGFNPADWSTPILTNGPGGVLRGTSFSAPPIMATQTNQPVATNVLSSSVIVYDLGQNAATIPILTCHGQAGAVIQITPAELVDSDGTVNRNSVGGGICYWQYTLAGTGSEACFPKFFYHGARYLQVRLIAAPGSSTLPVVDNLQGVCFQSAAAVGNFSCSFNLFNQTRNLIRWAQRNNLVSLISDCPTRERLGYQEQAHLNGPSLRYEFDVGQLQSKSLQDMADSQADQTGSEIGMVPIHDPQYGVFYNDNSPEWGSSVILVPWQHYLFTGDDTLLRNYYNAMTNYFAFLQNEAGGYVLNHGGLGDWYDIGPNPQGASQNTPPTLTADAYYCQDAQTLALIAAEQGNTSDAARFSQLATNIANGFNATYYSAANGYYSTGSQTAQAMPLYLGIVPPAYQAIVLSNLVANVNSKGLTAGEVGHRYLLRALTDQGRPDVVYALNNNSNYPGYGFVLNQGATALTEAWNNTRDSQDHFMNGHITEWFYHDLAGIQWDTNAPGYQNIIIKPAFVGNLTWVNASYNSVRGLIVSDWALTNSMATLNVTIPVGSTGQVWLPLLANVSTNLTVTESGTPIWQNGAATGGLTDVAFNQVEGTNTQTCLVWNIGSGSYQFAWNAFPAPTGLYAGSGNAQVNLSWNAQASVTGYNVKRSTTSGGLYTILAGGFTGTNYIDITVTNGVTYHYVVSAVKGSLESANSLEASATPASATACWSRRTTLTSM